MSLSSFFLLTVKQLLSNINSLSGISFLDELELICLHTDIAIICTPSIIAI